MAIRRGEPPIEGRGEVGEALCLPNEDGVAMLQLDAIGGKVLQLARRRAKVP